MNCKTCNSAGKVYDKVNGGKGFAGERYSHYEWQACPTCNGTGKAKETE